MVRWPLIPPDLPIGIPKQQLEPIYFSRKDYGPHAFLSLIFPCSFTACDINDQPMDHVFTSQDQYINYIRATILADITTQELNSAWRNGARGREELARRSVLVDMVLKFSPGGDCVVLLDRYRIMPRQHERWKGMEVRVAEYSVRQKFTQDITLRAKLIRTGPRELVYASSGDRMWGIGFAADKAYENRANWGDNVLGKALMRVQTGAVR